MSAIWVEIEEVRGSAPRDAGTVMQVRAKDTVGTIGGGALEHRAIATARRMLAQGDDTHVETVPLGPGLGQCCGGSVRLLFTTQVRTSEPEPVLPLTVPALLRPLPLWLWGAGHVGRAVVRAAPPQAFDITWADTGPDRFPARVPAHVTTLPARDLAMLAMRAPEGAHHLIFTYSHDIDLALCAALLGTRAASIGLIGSKTKWARFSGRLLAMGLDPTPITCPIGDRQLGKTPAAIAHGTLAALLATAERKVPA
jgi:xanthine dehydrogenase accessory factor